jgi:hypothetical protein
MDTNDNNNDVGIYGRNYYIYSSVDDNEELKNLPLEEGGLYNDCYCSQPYGIAISRVLMQVGGATVYLEREGKIGITSRAIHIINRFLLDVKNRFIVYLLNDNYNTLNATANSNSSSNNSTQKLITSKDLDKAVEIVIQKELAKHGISEANKALLKATNSIETRKGRKEYFSVLAGLQFPVMCDIDNNNNNSWEPNVYVATLMEYLGAEICLLSNNLRKLSNTRKIVTSKDVLQAIEQDEELKELFYNHNQPSSKIAKILA